jgi:hypothetical protein
MELRASPRVRDSSHTKFVQSQWPVCRGLSSPSPSPSPSLPLSLTLSKYHSRGLSSTPPPSSRTRGVSLAPPLTDPRPHIAQPTLPAPPTIPCGHACVSSTIRSTTSGSSAEKTDESPSLGCEIIANAIILATESFLKRPTRALVRTSSSEGTPTPRWRPRPSF